MTHQSDFIKPYDKEMTTKTLNKLYKIVQEISDHEKILILIN